MTDLASRRSRLTPFQSVLFASAVWALLGLAGCSGLREAPDEPTQTALQLFELASNPDSDEARFIELFGQEPNLAAAATLLDALAELGRAGAPQVVHIEPLEGLDKFAIDLTAELPGGAVGNYSVQISSKPDGTRRVTWFRGPGVQWPSARRRGNGLSSSPAE